MERSGLIRSERTPWKASGRFSGTPGPSCRRLAPRAVGITLAGLDDARYLIPRTVRVFEKTWFSKMLPRVIGRYFDRRTNQLIMWHKVPTALATQKELAQLFQKHWNHYVSPGEVVYAHREEGRAIQAQANESGLAPNAILHEKEVFV